MEVAIKQLTLHGKVFVPQTIAEAVLVKDGTQVITLDTALKKKVELIFTPAGSGLQASRGNGTVTIVHANSIAPNDSPSAIKIKYDNRGHVVETAPMNKLTVVVDLTNHTEYNGSEDSHIIFGDDFGDDTNKIILKWNHL